jgi:large subunit ribosomal protein LP0
MAEEYDPLNPPKSARKIRKEGLKAKLDKYLVEYKNVLICTVDNVGSHQMQKVRISLRGKAVVLMGKNTICRKAIREHMADNASLEALLPFVRGNIGFVFTNEDLNEVRKIVLENKVPAAAKQGSIAPIDVVVPPGPTGLDPGQTGFFQALNISTKIARGSIEIINSVVLVHAGEKVSSSHVALLGKLNINPFFYGIKVTHVYENGSVYDASILDLTKADLTAKFFAGVRKIAALSLAIGYPTIASVPHILGGAFRKLLYVGAASGYEFKEAKQFMEAGAAAASAAPAAASSAAPAAGGASKKVVEEPKEEEVVEDEEGGFGGMFD